MKTIEQILREIKNKSVSAESMQQMGEMIRALLDDSRKSVGLDLDNFSATALGGLIDSKIKLLEEERSSLDGFVDVDKEIEGLTDEAIAAIRDRIVKKYEAGELNDEEAKTLKRLFKKYLELQKSQDKFNQGLEKGNAAAKQLLQATLGLSTEWAFLSDTRGFSGLWKGVKKGMMESLSFTNVMASVVSKVVERAFEFDKLQADLFQKTGIKREDMNLMEMTEDLRGMSSDYAQVGQKAIVDLQNQFRDFGSLSKDDVEMLGNTIAVLEKRGAASSSTIDALSNLTKAVGFTSVEANQILLNQVAIADVSQRPVQEQLSEFQTGLTNLARFGKDSVSILSKMKLDANKSNVELRTLLGLSEKADTFEGAAQMAQAFNVAIAGPFGASILNPLELVGASMEEKVQVLQRKYKEAGSPVLSPRVLRELSASFQVPENELLKIFNVESSKIGTKQDDVLSASTTLKDQTKLISKNADAQEKIMAAMKHFADKVLEMVGGSNGLITIVDGITDGIKFLSDNIYTVTLGLGAIYGIQLANSYRGATMGNPEFVRSQSGPGPTRGGRGALGTVMKTVGIVTAAVGTGMAIDAMTNDEVPTSPSQSSPGGGMTPLTGGSPRLGGNSGANLNLTNDGPGNMSGGRSMKIPRGGSVPKMVSTNYVAPQIDLVHKDDKLYFAKNDGALMSKISEAKSKALSNSEKKQPTVIRISKREFKEMISEALGDLI